MIEVMIALLILGLVVTSSLKLVAISERGLASVRERETLINEAGRLQILLTRDTAQTFGISGDVSWKIEEEKSPLWFDETIDIDNLMLDGESKLLSGDKDKFKAKEQRWKKLEVTRKNMSLNLFLPYEEDDDVISLDRSTSAKPGDKK